MGAKRKQHSAQFKAQVAMAALAGGDKTLAELASEYRSGSDGHLMHHMH